MSLDAIGYFIHKYDVKHNVLSEAYVECHALKRSDPSLCSSLTFTFCQICLEAGVSITEYLSFSMFTTFIIAMLLLYQYLLTLVISNVSLSLRI
jgi:hypothetical protein